MNDTQKLGNGRFITADMLQDLPEPVQQYLTYTGVVGTPWVENVFLKQRGKFRLGLDKPWMPVNAEEWYTIDPPSFRWDARFKIAGLPLLRVKDKYEAGHGAMLGKAVGLFKVVDACGEEIDQGSMMRYLNEMIFFPTAFLGDNISWEQVDTHTADVTLTDCGKSVTGRLFFDEVGRITNFVAMRYRSTGDTFTLDPWSTPVTGYGVFAGLNLPTSGQAVWNLPSGDLVYVELKITELNYNYE